MPWIWRDLLARPPRSEHQRITPTFARELPNLPAEIGIRAAASSTSLPVRPFGATEARDGVRRALTRAHERGGFVALTLLCPAGRRPPRPSSTAWSSR